MTVSMQVCTYLHCFSRVVSLGLANRHYTLQKHNSSSLILCMVTSCINLVHYFTNLSVPFINIRSPFRVWGITYLIDPVSYAKVRGNSDYVPPFFILTFPSFSAFISHNCAFLVFLNFFCVATSLTLY